MNEPTAQKLFMQTVPVSREVRNEETKIMIQAAKDLKARIERRTPKRSRKTLL